MKSYKQSDIPGMQTRVVIKLIPGRINPDDSVQLDLPLSHEAKKRV